MDNFEEILEKAQNGDNKAMNELILQYLPMIKGLVKGANKYINKSELEQYLTIKFTEKVKKFKKF